MNNYQIAAAQAQKQFPRYDREAVCRKFHFLRDSQYYYPRLMDMSYRISWEDGKIERKTENSWVKTDSYEEIMTLLDLILGSREDRHLSGAFRSTQSFGNHYHDSLLGQGSDPLAEEFDAHPQKLQQQCRELGGIPFSQGDMAWELPFFEGLPVRMVFWHGDEEFPPRLIFYWDENALMYLKYETMHYAVAVLRRRLAGLQ